MNLTDLTSDELYELYDDRWAAYCAARASYHNALREKIPELIEKHHVQAARLSQTLHDVLEEIESERRK